MSKVLYIKANPKDDKDSRTFTLSNAFLDEYKKKNPQDEIITLDLYKENIKPLDGKMLNNMFHGVDDEIRKNATLFANSDKYIIAAPLWNLSIPSILKSYLDYVVYLGITYKYTENGPVGLLKDKSKKAVHIVSRGGSYGETPAINYEMGDKYLRIILGFMGISDFSTIALENSDVLKGDELEEAKNNAIQKAIELAKTF